MIITITGADFSKSNIGTLNSWTVSKSIGAGANHSIPSFVTKGAQVSWTITLADGYTFGSYEIKMGNSTITPTVSGNTMTINLTVTGNVVIKVPTINEGTGEEEPPVTPEQPGTGGGTNLGNTMRFLVDYNIDSDGKIYQWPYNEGQGGGKEGTTTKVDCRIILLDYIETKGKDVSVDFSNITGINKVALRYYDSSKNILTNYTSPVGSSYCRIILISDSKSTVNNYNNSTITINGIQYSLSDYAIKSIDENIVLFQPNGNIWSDGRNTWSSKNGRVSIITYIPSNGSTINVGLTEINSMLGITYTTTACRYYNDSLEYMSSATNSKYGRCIFVTQDAATLANGLNADDCISKMVNKTITINGKQYTLKDIKSL
jgi:hypothetical protein